MRFYFFLLFVGWFVCPGVVSAQAEVPSTTYPVRVERIPKGFSEPAPKSIKELQEMQDHLTALIPRLKECTVNLHVGGAQGSGVIVSADGYIITAAHVAGPPRREVRVTMPDGSIQRAETLGRNRILDASLLKLKSSRTDWPFCEMAEPVGEEHVSSPGDWCIVIAHPGGYQKERGSVTRLGRVILENRWMIQTDCELVGGDSGGPLFGVDGKVIGINTRIGEDTDLNFHVPIEAYTEEWDRFVAGEDFRTHSGAYMGVSGVVKHPALGMEITEVFPSDPGDRAGLKKGDLIMTFQNKRITSMQQLHDLIGRENPGKSVKLGIFRDGSTRDVMLRLGMKWD